MRGPGTSARRGSGRAAERFDRISPIQGCLRSSRGCRLLPPRGTDGERQGRALRFLRGVTVVPPGVRGSPRPRLLQACRSLREGRRCLAGSRARGSPHSTLLRVRLHRGVHAREEQLMATDAILSAEQLTKQYKSVLALNEISFTISAGVTGILGENGAGKSTAIKIFLG